MLAIIWNPVFGFGGTIIVQLSYRSAMHKAMIHKTCDGHHRLPERYGLLVRRLLAGYK